MYDLNPLWPWWRREQHESCRRFVHVLYTIDIDYNQMIVFTTCLGFVTKYTNNSGSREKTAVFHAYCIWSTVLITNYLFETIHTSETNNCRLSLELSVRSMCLRTYFVNSLLGIIELTLSSLVRPECSNHIRLWITDFAYYTKACFIANFFHSIISSFHLTRTSTLSPHHVICELLGNIDGWRDKCVHSTL